MLYHLRRWHWILLHRLFSLPDHDHTQPSFRSHPPVPAHQHHTTQRHGRSFHGQLERELQRQPHIFPRWQRFIGNLVFRVSSDQRLGSSTRERNHQ
jgi:hypothetical protein